MRIDLKIVFAVILLVREWSSRWSLTFWIV